MERETGIEPATNSLEGCDSTTELLPQSKSAMPSALPRFALVARGGFEPPKPLGRQIYSLLRLTAPQPRRLSVRDPCVRPASGGSFAASREGAPLVSYLNYDVCRRYLRQTWRPATLELAEGFEPPTG
jgi:hypothetical protein